MLKKMVAITKMIEIYNTRSRQNETLPAGKILVGNLSYIPDLRLIRLQTREHTYLLQPGDLYLGPELGSAIAEKDPKICH